jgi:predicted phosphoribosyltransferase
LAKKLQLPLDVIFTKKIGLPYNPEYAIGAVSDMHIFVNQEFATMPELQTYIAHEVAAIRKVIKERSDSYRQGMLPLSLNGKTVIVVDDGIATGSTLLATLALIKEYHPRKIVVALPVAPAHSLQAIKQEADEVVCYATPDPFYSVGQFYQHFEQVDDEQAIQLLHEANK